MQKKTCTNCNLSFELSNFYYIEKRNYTDNYCKDCRKLDWKIKRLEKEKRVKEKGFTSLHNYRVTTSENYKSYTQKKERLYNKENDFKRKKIGIDLASDYYIRQLIRKDKSMKSVEIPQELIDLYRSNLLLKRELNDNYKTENLQRM